jgi:hypothetical protein
MESPHWIDLVLGWVTEKRKTTTKVVLRSDRWVDTTVHPANWSRGKIPHFLLHKKYFHYLSLFSVPKNARPNHHLFHAIHHKLTTKTPRFAHYFSQKPL